VYPGGFRIVRMLIPGVIEGDAELAEKLLEASSE